MLRFSFGSHSVVRRAVGALLSVAVVGGGPVQAQDHRAGSHHAESHYARHAADGGPTAAPLRAPGQSVFGTVQEAIRQLEADSTTDWSAVDMEALRQHLIDMNRVAMKVAVEEKSSIENGVRLRVRPRTAPARASLERVLDAHPQMLRRETGWAMDVAETDSSYVLRVTTEVPGEVSKLRALGYIGLLAYGQHHQRHHWHMVHGHDPHRHDGS